MTFVRSPARMGCVFFLLCAVLMVVPTMADGGLANSPWPIQGQNVENTAQSGFTASQSAAIKWNYTMGGTLANNNPVIGPDGTIYIGNNGDSKVYAINTDGTLKWTYLTGGALNFDSPAIGSDGTIYIGDYTDKKLYAINPNGTLKWTSAACSGYIVDSPTIGSNGLIYVAGGNGKNLYAFNPTNVGSSNIAAAYTVATTVSEWGTPVIDSNGNIYIPPYGSAYYIREYSPTLTYLQQTNTKLPSFGIAIGSAGNIYETTTSKYVYNFSSSPSLTSNWDITTGGALDSSPAIAADGTIYIATGATVANVYALNPVNGAAKWTFTDPNGGNFGYNNPAIGEDGTIYIANAVDDYVFALNPADGSVKWSYKLEAAPYSPAIGSDGTVYISTADGQLHAFAGVADFTANQTTGTGPLPIQFTATSELTPTSWYWDFGDGTNSTLQNPPVHTYPSVGFYTVNLTIISSNGTNYITKSGYIKVYSPPVANFTANITAGFSPLVVNFTDQSTNTPTAWNWSFGDGSLSTVQNPVHSYSSAGTFTVNLTVTNPAGTSISLTNITVSTPSFPVASFTANVTTGANPLAVQFSDISSNYPTSWNWSFGDGNYSTVQNPSHTYAYAGTFTVSLNATNKYGSNTATETGYISVAVPAAPTAAFNISHRVGVAPLSVQFTDTSANYPTSWSWNFGDGTLGSNLQDPVHSYTVPGNYLVSFTATNALGSSTFTDTRNITILASQQPISAYDNVDVYVANPEGVKYDVPNGVWNLGTYPYQPNTYFLNLQGGLNPFHMSSLSNAMSAADTSITTSQLGSFWITFNGGQTTMPDAILMLAVNGTIPNDFAVNINASGQTFDVGTPSTTNQYQTGPPAVSTYVPVGINETFTKADFIYGTQNWKPCSSNGYPLFANENQSDPLNQFQIMFIDLRVGAIQNASLPDDGMINVQYSFTNLTSMAVFNGYGWYMQCNHGTGAPMTNAIPGGGGVIVLGVPGVPVANFAASTTNGYELASIQFTDTSTNNPSSWSWNFGDGTTSTLQNPSHTYSSAGIYTVTLTVTNSKGTNTVTKSGYILVTMPPLPVAQFSGSTTTGPAPLTVQFTDTSEFGPYVWLWNFGDGNTSTLQNPSHTYDTSGTYTVNLTVTNAKGSASTLAAGYITVYPAGAPVAGFTATPVNGVAPLAVQFTDTSTSGPTSWSWNFGDGSTSTVQNPSHTYTTAGTYNVTLTSANTLGSTSLTQSGLVYVTNTTGALPSYSNIYVRASNHEGVLYNANSNGTYYVETGGSGGGLNILHITTHPTIPDGQVTVSRNQSGTIYATSTGTYADDTILMLAVNGTIPNDFAIKVTSSGYTWTPTGSTPALGSITYQSPALSETFTKNDLFYGPQNWKPTQGNANYPLFYGEGMNLSANQNQLMFIDLRAGIPGTSYSGYSSLTNQGAVMINYSFNDLPDYATFNVYGWKSGTGMGWTNDVTAGGTSSSGYSVISSSIPIPPVAGFTASQTAGREPVKVQFTDTSTNTPTSWLWNFGDGNTSTAQNPTYTYTTPGVYTVSLIVSNGGGSNTTTQAGYITVNQPVITTNLFAITGVQATTTGSAQTVTIDKTTTNTTVAGNFVNLTNVSSTWSSRSIKLAGAPVTSGTTVTGTVSSVQAVTQPVVAQISPVLTANVSVALNLTRVPASTASITSTISSDPNTTAQSSFTAAATSAGDQIVANAYTVTFTKNSIANVADGGIISSATIIMAVSPSWVAAHGGTSDIVIMHQTDSGTTTILKTTFAGTDASGNDLFTAVSPTGLSIFTLTAISPLSSGSSGFTSSYGGSSSDSGGSFSSTSFALTASAVGPGQAMNFAVNEGLNGNLNYGISTVSIVPSQALGSTQLTVGDAGASMSSTITGRQVAGVVQIEPVGVNPSSISQGTITFQLSGAWMTAHSLTPADIVLLRDVNGQWTELPTTFSTQSGSTYTFTATTPGFSYFAIAGRLSTGTAAAVTTTSALQSSVTGAATPAVPTTPYLYPATPRQTTAVPAAMQPFTAPASAATPASGKGPSLVLIAAGIVGIVLIAAGGFLVRRWWIRRQNPALFRKYD